MIGVRASFFVALLVVAVGYYATEARPGGMSEREFENKLAAFLAQDKEVQSVLEKASLYGDGPAMRHRRQAEMEGMDVDSMTDEAEGPKEPGFFDRAAKFVMELLQRFLKWINTDDN